jgi:hypothetical protein
MFVFRTARQDREGEKNALAFFERRLILRKVFESRPVLLCEALHSDSLLIVDVLMQFPGSPVGVLQIPPTGGRGNPRKRKMKRITALVLPSFPAWPVSRT